MLPFTNVATLSVRMGLVVPLLLLCGCPASSQKDSTPNTAGNPSKKSAEPTTAPADAKAPTTTPVSTAAEPTKDKVEPQAAGGDGDTDRSSPGKHISEIPANLGEPLVDAPNDLRRLEMASPVWIDAKRKQVVLLGTACKADYPLEFLATYPDRKYESVLVIYTQPSVVHAALVALGAKPGKPAQFRPAYSPPTGAEVEIDVCWKDKDGKRQQTPAQQLIRDIKTGKALDVNWVFAGSVFWEDKETGSKSYLADRGDFITVLNLPTALLDIPLESNSALESRLFEGFTEHLPPPGTSVTLILKPKVEAAETK